MAYFQFPKKRGREDVALRIKTPMPAAKARSAFRKESKIMRL